MDAESSIYRMKKKNSYKVDNDDVLKNAEVFLDTRELLKDGGGRAILRDTVWSKDGKYMAY